MQIDLAGPFLGCAAVKALSHGRMNDRTAFGHSELTNSWIVDGDLVRNNHSAK